MVCVCSGQQVKARYPAEKDGAGCDLRPDFDLPEPPLEYCEAKKPSEEVFILNFICTIHVPSFEYLDLKVMFRGRGES